MRNRFPWSRRSMKLIGGAVLTAGAMTFGAPSNATAQLPSVDDVGDAVADVSEDVERQVEKAGEAAEWAAERAEQAADRNLDKADRAAEQAEERLERGADRARRRADRALDEAGRAADRAADRAEDAIDRGVDRITDEAEDVGDAVRDVAGDVVDDVRRAVNRPRLGVTFDRAADGVIIGRVDRNSVAYRAGLRRGDAIASINGRRFDRYHDAVRYINGVDAGEDLDIIVIRDGERVNLSATLAAHARRNANRASLGVFFDTTSERPLKITRIVPNSPAHQAGLRAGDYVLSLDGRRVRTHRGVTNYLADLRPNDRVDVAVWRDGQQRDIDVQLAAHSEVFAEGNGERRYDREARREAQRLLDDAQQRRDRIRERVDDRLEDREESLRDRLDRREEAIERRLENADDRAKDRADAKVDSKATPKIKAEAEVEGGVKADDQ